MKHEYIFKMFYFSCYWGHSMLLAHLQFYNFYNLKFDHLCLYLLENVHVFLCFVFKID